MTEIKDHLTYANGVPVNGRIIVSWQAFLIGGGVSIAGGSVTSEILDGDLELELESNAGSQPRDNYYTATYELESGPVYVETWIVPAVGQANLAQVRVNFPVQPSVAINPLQLTSLGASPGQFLQWNGTSWIPQYISITAVDPNYIQVAVSAQPAADIAVIGSPVVLGNLVTINIPNAGGTSRGVVTTTAQNFAGAKRFLDDVDIDTLINLADHPEYLDSQHYRSIYCANDFFVTANIGVLSGKNLGNPVPQAGAPRDPEITWQQAQYLFRHDSPFWGGAGWAGIGCDSGGNVWLRTGLTTVGEFFYLQPNGATQTRQARFDVFQHPTAPGAAVQQHDATLVPYAVNSTGDWIGLGVDTSPALWIHVRSGVAGSADYVFGVATATFPFLNVTGTLTIAGQPAMINPMTTHGDLIVYGSGGTARFPCGVDGQGLITDQTTVAGLRWANLALNPTTTRGDLIVNDGVRLVRQPVGLPAQVLSTDLNATTGLKWVNAMDDPTTQIGDLITRDAFGLTRLPVGLDGEFLQADSNSPKGLTWVAGGGGGGGGSQTPWESDINAAGYSLNDVGRIGVGLSANADTLVSVNVFTLAPNHIGFRHHDNSPGGAPGLQAVNDKGHFGCFQMVGSTWSTAWADVLAVYTAGPADIVFAIEDSVRPNSEVMRLQATTGRVGIGTAAPAYLLDVAGAMNATSVLVNGAAALTNPWTSDVNAANFKLNSVNAIGIGMAAGTRGLSITDTAAISFDISATNTNPLSTAGISLLNDSSDQIQFGVGGSSILSPSLRRLAFLLTTRDLIFGTGSTFAERMRITAAGNVGIGTQSPQARLHVSAAAVGFAPLAGTQVFASNSGGAAYFEAACAAVGDSCGYLFSSGGSLTSYIIDISTQWQFVSAARPVSFNLGGAERLRITTGGNVGIGTAVPGNELHVAGDVTRQVRLSGATSQNANLLVGYDVGNNTGVVEAFSAGAVRPLLLNPSGGNVGIGTTNPLQALSVITANRGSAATVDQFSIGEISNNAAYRLTLGYFNDGSSYKGAIQATNAGPANGFLLLNPLGGLVGIGTTYPTFHAHVYGLGAAEGIFNPANNIGNSLCVQDSGGAAGNGGAIVFGAVQGEFAAIKGGIANGGGYTVGDLEFYTRGDISDPSMLERMRITLGGNVGIGTTNPTVRLGVVNAALGLPTPGTPFGCFAVLSDTPNWGLYFGAINNGTSWIQTQRADGNTATYPLVLNPNGGFVGIGTSAPLARLDVVTGNTPYTWPGSAAGGFRIATDPWNSAPSLFFGVDGTIVASWIQAVQPTASNNPLLLNPNGGHVGIGGSGSYLPLTVFNSGAQDPSLSASTGLLMLYCNNGVTLSAGLGLSNVSPWLQGKFSSNDGRAFPISLNPLGGGVAIGKLGPGYALDVVGDVNCSGTFRVNGAPFSAGVQIQLNGAFIATVPIIDCVNGGSGTLARVTNDPANSRVLIAWDTPSDRRIKQNVTDLSGGLSVVDRLRPVAFEYNGLCGFTAGKRSASIVAQELQEVLPDAVYAARARLRPEDEEDIDLLCFDPMQILAHATLAIQQLERRVKVLEGRVN